MRTLLFTACAGLVFTAIGNSAEPKDNKPPEVKEFEVKGLIPKWYSGSVKNPVVFKEAKDLDKAFDAADIRAGLQKQVNWKEQVLLLFAWSGSGQDKLAFEVKDGKNGPEVVFSYAAGFTRDLRRHAHLYLLPKDVAVKVQNRPKN